MHSRMFTNLFALIVILASLLLFLLLSGLTPQQTAGHSASAPPIGLLLPDIWTAAPFSF